MNIFETTKTTVKKASHYQPAITNEECKLIEQWAEKKILYEKTKAEMEFIADQIKANGFQAWLKKSLETQHPEGSVILSKAMITVKNQFPSVSQELHKKYPNLFEVKKQYQFNNEVLINNMQAISDALMAISSISQSDKANMFIMKEKITAKSNTLAKAVMKKSLANKLFQDILPIISLRLYNK